MENCHLFTQQTNERFITFRVLLCVRQNVGFVWRDIGSRLEQEPRLKFQQFSF